MSIRDEIGISLRSVVYTLLATGLVIVSGSLLMAWKPWVMAYDREVFQESRQYVEAKQRLLLKLAADYEAAKGTGHATALMDRIRSEAALIPASEIPGPVRHYLGGLR